MIKIKNYIFNENEIFDISQSDFDGKRVIVHFINTDRYISIEKATLEDIEWNYENNNEYCNVFYEDRIKELEEENKRLELENEKHKSWVNSLNKDNHKFRDRIDKAIEYIIERYDYQDHALTHTFDKDNVRELLKILKGEENESN